MQINQFHVPGMRGAACVRAIAAALEALPGVQWVDINLATKAVRVAHEEHISVSTLITTIKRAGYPEVAMLV